MRDDLLDPSNMAIGRPTPWPNGDTRISFYITHRYMMFRYDEVTRELEAWCKSNLTKEYKIMHDFNQGDPYWSLCLDKEDAVIFVLHFGKAIC